MMRMSDPSIQDSPSAPLNSGLASSLPPPAAATGGRSPRFTLFIVFLVVVIDLLGFGIVLPLLPIYGDLYVGHLIDSNSHWVGAIVGSLLAIFSLMQFIFAPIWGRVSDRVGRRPILLLGLAGSVIFYALFGFTTIYEGPEFPGFLAVRSGSATIGLSHRDDLSVEPVDRGVRWQFIVEDVDDVVAVCEANRVACEVIVEEGGTTHRGRIAKVTSPNGIQVWFEGPNELQ